MNVCERKWIVVIENEYILWYHNYKLKKRNVELLDKCFWILIFQRNIKITRLFID